MKRILLAIFLLSCSFTILTAQNYSVKGKVTSAGRPSEAATIRLLNADSGAVKQTISDKNGDFLMEYAVGGNYIVSVQSVGTQPYYTIISLDKEHLQADLKTISL